MTLSTNLCVVNIDLCTTLLMPAAKGLKLVELLQSAQLVEMDYTSARIDHQYQLKEQPRVEYRAVKRSQIQQAGASHTRKSVRDRKPMVQPE